MQGVAAARGARESLPFAKDISAATRAYVGNPLTGAAPTGEFEQEKRAVEAQQERAAEEAPVAKTAGEIGGYFLPGVGLAGRAAKAEQALAAKAAPYLGETGANIASGALTGAGLGAVQGLGTGTDLSERLASAETMGGLGAVGGGAFPALGAGVSKIMKSTPVEEAAARLGASVPASISSTNPLTRRVAQGLEALPFTKGIMESGAKKGLSEVGEALEKVPGIASPGKTAQEAGASAGESLRSWINTDSKKAVNRLYDKVAEHVDPAIKTPMSNTLKAVQGIDAERLAAKLGDSPTAKLVLDAATDPEGLTYAGAQRLKREIGEKMKGLMTESSLSEAELKQLYGGLREDVRAAARNAGGDKGLAAFDRANSVAQTAITRRKALGKIVGVKGDAPDETIFNKLTGYAQDSGRANIDLLKKARKSMSPGAWNDVSSGIIAKLGRDVEGNFTPDRFVTAYSKLAPEARNAVFGPIGNATRDALEDVLTVAQRYKDVGKGRNFSNTAHNLMSAAGLADIAIEGYEGLEHGAVLGATTIPLALLLSRPRAARAFAAYMKKPTPQLLNQAKNTINMELRTHMGKTMQPMPIAASDEREAHAAGGKVGKRDYPAKRLTRMERAVKRAQEAIALETKPLMDRPDEQIARALEIAKDK
jgi:hypothetical protein